MTANTYHLDPIGPSDGASGRRYKNNWGHISGMHELKIQKTDCVPLAIYMGALPVFEGNVVASTADLKHSLSSVQREGREEQTDYCWVYDGSLSAYH